MLFFAFLIISYAAIVSPPKDTTTSNLLANIFPRSIFATTYHIPSWTSSLTAPQSNTITTLLLRIGLRRTKVTEAVPVEYTCHDAATTLPDLSRAMRIVPDPLLPIVENEPCTCCTTFSGLDAQTVCSGSTCETLLGPIRTSLDELEPAPPRPDFMASRRVRRSRWQKFVLWVKFPLRRNVVQVIGDFCDFLLAHYGTMFKSVLLLIGEIKVFYRLLATFSKLSSRYSTRAVEIHSPPLSSRSGQVDPHHPIESEALTSSLPSERTSLRLPSNQVQLQILDNVNENEPEDEEMKVSSDLEDNGDALREMAGLGNSTVRSNITGSMQERLLQPQRSVGANTEESEDEYLTPIPTSEKGAQITSPEDLSVDSDDDDDDTPRQY